MSIDGALYGLGAACAWGFSDVGATIVSRRVGSTRTTGMVVGFSCLLLVIVFLASGAPLPADRSALLGSLVLGLGGASIYFTGYAALRRGPITIVAPILSAAGGLTVLFAIVLLNEQPSAVSLVAAAVATCGVILAGVVFGGAVRVGFRGPGVGFALVCLAIAAGMPIAASLVIRQAGWLPALTFARITNAAIVGSVLLVLGRIKRRREQARGAPDARDPTSVPFLSAGRRTIALVLAVGAVEVVAVCFFFAGLSVGPTWLVGLMSSFAPLMVVAAGVVLFRERPRPLQWVGVAMVLGSTLVLAAR